MTNSGTITTLLLLSLYLHHSVNTPGVRTPPTVLNAHEKGPQVFYFIVNQLIYFYKFYFISTTTAALFWAQPSTPKGQQRWPPQGTEMDSKYHMMKMIAATVHDEGAMGTGQEHKTTMWAQDAWVCFFLFYYYSTNNYNYRYRVRVSNRNGWQVLWILVGLGQEDFFTSFK